MCGIAGMMSPRPIAPRLIESMILAIDHRGPDDGGIWLTEDGRVGLGHRRLAVVQLGPLGHQPMHSTDGRFILVFSGEIYNHNGLRALLQDAGAAPNWRGHGDTETLVECIAAWGLMTTLQRATGMFAIALWDRDARSLALARDRFGEKPLYYGWSGGEFLFGSELKALHASGHLERTIDRTALNLYAGRGYVPAPFSIYRGIYKLEPGCVLTLDPAIAGLPPGAAPHVGLREPGLRMERYWSYRDVVREGLADPFASEDEALEALEPALAAAVRGQAMADVPVGALLSGGIDSSTVVALYRKYATGAVRTFTVGFEDERFDEAPAARAVAQHFGTEHHEQYVGLADALAIIPTLPAMYDEPFADSSQIATHLVSRLARRHVTVALSGDGGDELFGGYNRHVIADSLWPKLQRIPRPVRAGIGLVAGAVPATLWAQSARFGARHHASPALGTKLRRGAVAAAGARDLDSLYASLTDEYWGETSPVSMPAGNGAAANDALPESLSPAGQFMVWDAESYLPDDILCKVDRAAMAVSLETRIPFLDHHVAAAAARIPPSMKVVAGRGKHILRQLLYREAPAELFARPKRGFAIPVGEWLKAELRPWAESLLDSDRLRRDGYFDAEIVHRRWRDHLSGRRDSTAALWTVLMFQTWLDASF